MTVDNGLLGIGDLERASNVAAEVGIRHLLINASPLSLPEVKRNDPERCYHCKKFIFRRLKSIADELRLRVVLDGTNASDLKEYRPGIKALQELGTVSPLGTSHQEGDPGACTGARIAGGQHPLCGMPPYAVSLSHGHYARNA